MLRISITPSSSNTATLRLEGELAGAWMVELRGTCDRMLKDGQAITLDLQGVSSITREGFAWLASLSDKGVSLAGCSPFQKEQLRQIAANRQPAPSTSEDATTASSPLISQKQLERAGG